MRSNCFLRYFGNSETAFDVYTQAEFSFILFAFSNWPDITYELKLQRNQIRLRKNVDRPRVKDVLNICRTHANAN